VPPRRGRLAFGAVFLAFAAVLLPLGAAFLVLRTALRDFAALFLRPFPLEAFAPALRRPVFRLAEPVRLAPAPLRLVLAFRLEGVRFRPVLFAVFFAVFLAMC
jgi:hypothetical protein